MNNLDLLSLEGDIKNIGANISSIKDLNLVSLNGNILNSAIVQTNDAKLLASNSDSYQLALGDSARSSGNIQSSLLHNASLTGGNINIIAAKDFTNLAASIDTIKAPITSPLEGFKHKETTQTVVSSENGHERSESLGGEGSNDQLTNFGTTNQTTSNQTSSGNLIITAGNDINIGTLELRNRTEIHTGRKKNGHDLIIDNTTNLQSDLDSAGDISINSGNDTTLQATKITAGDVNDDGSGNIDINAGNNLLLTTAQDSSFKMESIRKNKTFTFKRQFRLSPNISRH